MQWNLTGRVLPIVWRRVARAVRAVLVAIDGRTEHPKGVARVIGDGAAKGMPKALRHVDNDHARVEIADPKEAAVAQLGRVVPRKRILTPVAGAFHHVPILNACGSYQVLRVQKFQFSFYLL